MAPNEPAGGLVGRDELLARLEGSIHAAFGGGRPATLVSGPAGIGKTSLVRAAVHRGGAAGALVGWGTCVEGSAVPGYWAWRQALDALVRGAGTDMARALAGDDARLLSNIAPAFGPPANTDVEDRDRLLLMDAVGRWLDALAADRGVIVMLDDLQWADESTLELLEYVAGSPRLGAVCLIGAYRDDELEEPSRTRVTRLATSSEHVAVASLDPSAVAELVRDIAGPSASEQDVDAIYRRAAGHPFFTRELALLAKRAPGELRQVPAVVREAILQRVGRLPARSQQVLLGMSVAGGTLRPDVIGRALAMAPVEVTDAAVAALRAGVLTGDDSAGEVRFAHDLYREAIFEEIDRSRRSALQLEIAIALEERAGRTGEANAAEIAAHFTAAIALDGPERAGRWALAAAAHDCASLAFIEAAGHLRRWRGAVADVDIIVDDELFFEVLMAEADALARAGNAVDSRGLLRLARDRAERTGAAAGIARVALANARLGSRFATRRNELVRELEAALDAVAGSSPEVEARVTATLARELQHSVPEDRPRAEPLSRRALDLGRATGDDETLIECLLARHDILWTPGSAPDREKVAREIVDAASRGNDDERHAQGLLLLANALLELGSAAFRPALESCLAIADRLAQPRHRYTAMTRQAAVRLLEGDLEGAESLIAESSALGERIREPDTGNVLMSQRLELVRSRAVPEELASFADEAVRHWTGAPVHAHAVAAGFCARAGLLDDARRHVGTVLDLGTWRMDRSYLWSVFTRELAVAAIALDDRELSAELLADLTPLGPTCGVNGALVAFAGCHAHTAGLLARHLGEDDEALRAAADVYRHLGARRWLDEIEAVYTDRRPSGPSITARMRRTGGMWQLAFFDESATIAHTKGLADLAVLLELAGRDVHVLELADAAVVGAAGQPVADGEALAAYRQRLADLDADMDQAAAHNDEAQVLVIEAEREALLAELRQLTRPGGRTRSFANHPAERARKAVAGRIRDAIRKLEREMPKLAGHLDTAVVTGTYCRYRPEAGVTWQIDR